MRWGFNEEEAIYIVSHEFADITLFARRRAFHHEHVIDMSACSYNIY
jgi:hypothetical protein